jgi:predicted N-formylglutamate amidohydrolase
MQEERGNRMTSAEAVSEIGGAGHSRILLLCDHATNVIPPDVAGGDLGLPPEEMARHIAWDIGAAGVTEGLARLLEAPALMTRFSRLVIDPNRGEDDPTLVMRLYDGTIIPANRAIARTEVERRLDAYHRPYHRAIAGAIERLRADGRAPALVSIHSFTPRLIGRAARPWHVGILWHRDGRIALPLIARLRAEGLCVGDNEPYSGELEGDTMSRHGTRNRLPHVLIELRQDLIAGAEDQRLWVERLAPILRQVIDEVPDG